LPKVEKPKGQSNISRWRYSDAAILSCDFNVIGIYGEHTGFRLVGILIPLQSIVKKFKVFQAFLQIYKRRK
jgi:hypothetical protein